MRQSQVKADSSSEERNKAMSYDLMVFEKGKIPADKSDFLNWYLHKMECGEVKDISGVSEKLQHFFHAVREIFPPMNGAFAPDDKALSENPSMEDYLCEYDIREDMIYLAFAYSVSGYAYDTIRRAAYFAGLGFFNPSSDNSQPVLFDSRCPMLLEGEWFRPVEVTHFDQIREKLNNMTVKNRSYLYVTDLIGNYIQIGGYGKHLTTADRYFTVEKRTYSNLSDYVHARAELPDTQNADKTGEVMIAGNHVKVKESQILPKDTAEQLFLDFFRNEETVDSVAWVEMDI